MSNDEQLRLLLLNLHQREQKKERKERKKEEKNVLDKKRCQEIINH